MVFVLLGILVLAAIVVVGVVVWKMRRNRLSAYVLEELQLRLTQALEHEDMHRRVLEGEKVIDHALKLLKYQGTFAEKLTEAQWRFSDPEALWSAHRIRNSIAHDLGITIQPRTIDYACKALSQALRDLS